MPIIQSTETHCDISWYIYARFDNIHIDIVGPLPPSSGYTYILTCIDHFTSWPEATEILLRKQLLKLSLMAGLLDLVYHQ